MTTSADYCGRYRLDEKLGEGGMAEAYRATLVEGGFEKAVCLKRVLPEHAGTAAFIEMFQDEARISAHLQHDNIVQVFELGKAGGTFFIAMELVDGCNLNTVLKRGVRCSVAQALAIGVALTKALDHAHSAVVNGKPLELIHRDVTPENVLLGKDGRIKLSDFGIAKARDRLTKTKTGIIKGKLSYMAPEQARGDELDQRVDQWAAGVVVWEVLTGRPLFRRKGELAILQAVTREPILPPSQHNPDVPPAVDDVVLKALQRDRAQRYPNMRAFCDALSRCLRDVQKKASDVDLKNVVAKALDAPAPVVAGGAAEAVATISEGRKRAFTDDAGATEPSQPSFHDDDATLLSDPGSINSAETQKNPVAPSAPSSETAKLPAVDPSSATIPLPKAARPAPSPGTVSTARPIAPAPSAAADQRNVMVAMAVAGAVVVAGVLVIVLVVAMK